MALSDDIYEAIRQDLLRARWQPGARLKIREIAAEKNVSPMPVRVAIKQLGQDGYLETSDNRSARVPAISRETFNDYYMVAIELEGLAIERAASCLTDRNFEEIQAAAAKMREAVDRRDGPAYVQRYNELLMQIYELAGSRALVEMIERAWMHTASQAAILFKAGEVVVQLDKFNQLMMAALARRDGPAAREALTDGLLHMQRLVNVLLDISDGVNIETSSGGEQAKSYG